MTRVPEPWEAVLLALAAFRIFRLLAGDVILRPLRVRLIRRAEIPGETYIGGKPYRRTLDEFVHCPWCLGWWITLGWWIAWLVWPRGSIVAAVPFALSAIVGLVSHNLDD